MEKEKGQIKFIETDEGYRIEVKGKDLKDILCCCCAPAVVGGKAVKAGCCEPSEKEDA